MVCSLLGETYGQKNTDLPTECLFHELWKSELTKTYTTNHMLRTLRAFIPY